MDCCEALFSVGGVSVASLVCGAPYNFVFTRFTRFYLNLQRMHEHYSY